MSLRQSMSGLHTWSGLLVSWLLFVVIFSGSLSCFEPELTRWMLPQLHEAQQPAVGVDQVHAALVERAPKAHAYWMLPPTERGPYWTAGWVPSDLSAFRSFLIDAQTGEELPKTVGGGFFFELHYALHAGTLGIYIVGIAGMFMLVALVSGVIVHRRIFKDFFTLRPKAARQRSWLDAHNVLGVIGLPFHVLLAYTGLVIFITLYMQAGIKVAYKGDFERFEHEVQHAFDREELGRPAKPPKPISRMVERAREQWGDDSRVGWINLEHPNDASSMVQIRRAVDRGMVNDQRTVSFDAATGALLHVQPPYGNGYKTYAWLTGLHMAQFGGTLVRILYLLLGLVGCGMIFGGLQVWVAKREARGSAGLGLVRTLNAAVCGGLPLASLDAYVDRHAGHPLQVADLARLAGLSAARFHARFLAETGQTPMDYVRQRRLQLGRELLCATHLAVGEIAARVGYASQSAFTAALVRQFGSTPRQIRREARDNSR